MARRRVYRMTPARRRALRKAQLASARARKRAGSMSRRKKVAAGVAVAGASYFAYRKMTYTTMYHNTSHHQARQIIRNGFEGGKGRKGPPNTLYKQTGTGRSTHEQGRVFFSVGYNHRIAKHFGNARLKVTVKRKHVKKYGLLDDHPAAINNNITNFYSFTPSQLKKMNAKVRYTRTAQLRSRYKINKAALSPAGSWEYPRLRRI